MTREQFAVWLIGHLNMTLYMQTVDHRIVAAPTDVQKLGDEVLAAARTVAE